VKPRTPEAENVWHDDGRHLDGHVTGSDGEFQYQPFTIGCMIYLEDVYPRQGGFLVWPGSHREIAKYHQNHDVYELGTPSPPDDLDLGHPQEVVGPAGTVAFFHHNMVHTGAQNLSEHIRLAAITRFSTEDIESLHDDVLSDPWLCYDAIRDLEPLTREKYYSYRNDL